MLELCVIHALIEIKILIALQINDKCSIYKRYRRGQLEIRNQVFMIFNQELYFLYVVYI